MTEYYKTYHVCQVIGKPNQNIVRPPLCPIPVVGEPFSEIYIDVMGSLPPSKRGNQYLLTIMCIATIFSEAIALRSIHAKIIVRELGKLFSMVGLSKVIQLGQSSNLKANKFQSDRKVYREDGR